MKTVYLSEYIHPQARALLDRHVKIIDQWDKLEQADGLINRNLPRIDSTVLNRAPRLKVIAVHGTGTDGVDLAEAASRGVEVFSTPGLNAVSVAELNVALALMFRRRLYDAVDWVKGSREEGDILSVLQGSEISGSTVGILGMGNIGRHTARMFRDGFGAKVVAWSRRFTPQLGEQLGVTWCASVEQVLCQADIIVLALASTPDTEGIINRDNIGLCKSSAVLINTARGALVDEAALYTALTTGVLAGAACDVFCQEPVTMENPLAALPNVLPTPHLGANTEQALYRLGMAVVTGMLDRLGVAYGASC